MRNPKEQIVVAERVSGGNKNVLLLGPTIHARLPGDQETVTVAPGKRVVLEVMFRPGEFPLAGSTPEDQAAIVESIFRENRYSPRSRIAAHVGDVVKFLGVEKRTEETGTSLAAQVVFQNFSQTLVTFPKEFEFLRVFTVPEESVTGNELLRAVKRMSTNSVLVVTATGERFTYPEAVKRIQRGKLQPDSLSELFFPYQEHNGVAVQGVARGGGAIDLDNLPPAGHGISWVVDHQPTMLELRRTGRVSKFPTKNGTEYMVVISGDAPAGEVPHGHSRIVSTHWEGLNHRERRRRIIGEHYREDAHTGVIPQGFTGKLYKVKEIGK